MKEGIKEAYKRPPKRDKYKLLPTNQWNEREDCFFKKKLYIFSKPKSNFLTHFLQKVIFKIFIIKNLLFFTTNFRYY